MIEIIDHAPEETEAHDYGLTADDIRITPGAANDALRAVAMTPATARIPYSFGGLVLRGMSPRDSRVFVDGVEVPIAFHLGGISSVLPTSVLDELRLIPSGFDVSIGRTQGGVIELTTRRPRRDRMRVGGALSLLHAAAIAEGPMGRDGAFLLAVRRSYLDLLARPFLGQNELAPNYLDGQLLGAWGSPASGQTTAYLLASLDGLSNSSAAGAAGSPDAKGHVIARLGFLRTGAEYRRNLGHTTVKAAPYVGTNVLTLDEKDHDDQMRLDERHIRRRWYQYGGRAEWLRDDAGGFLRAGLDVAGGYLGRVSADAVFDDALVDADEIPLPRSTVMWTDAAVWFETRRHWLDNRLSVRPGIRVDRFGLGNETTVDLRANAHATVSDTTVLRGSIGRYHQPPSPAHFDEWLDNLHAASSYVDQATLAAEWSGRPELKASLAGFWHEGRKTLVDDVPPHGFLSDLETGVFRELVEEQLGLYGHQTNDGRQRSYGMEVSIGHDAERWRVLGNLAWSRSLRQYVLPDHAWVPYELDQPLRLNVIGGTSFGRWNIGARLSAASGNPVRIFASGTVIDAAHDDPATAEVMRLPVFWQLDFRVDTAWHRRWGTISLVLDVLNATNHRNVEQRENLRLVSPGAPASWGYADTHGLPIIPIVGVEVVPR